MSPTNQNNWNTYAAAVAQAKTNSLGQTYYASGWNWFCAMNTINQILGRSIYVLGPTNAVLGAPTLTSLTIQDPASGPSQISVVTAEYNSGIAAWLELRIVNGQGQSSRPNRPKLVWTMTNPAVASNDITDEVAAAFGNVQAGQRCFYWYRRILSQGRAGLIRTGYVAVI